LFRRPVAGTFSRPYAKRLAVSEAPEVCFLRRVTASHAAEHLPRGAGRNRTDE
jgi:hypothetical protein